MHWRVWYFEREIEEFSIAFDICGHLSMAVLEIYDCGIIILKL